jgi:heme exporter protein CcmD
MLEALNGFIAMGGYGGFVWSAYGIALVVLGGFSLHAWRRYRAGVRALAELQRQIGTEG